MNNNNIQGIVWDIQRQLKLTDKEARLLMDAYRRKNLLGATSPKFWNLATGAAVAKCKYFLKPSRIERGVSDWQQLNAEGLKMLSEIEKRLPVPSGHKAKNELNLFLFTYQS